MTGAAGIERVAVYLTREQVAWLSDQMADCAKYDGGDNPDFTANVVGVMEALDEVDHRFPTE